MLGRIFSLLLLPALASAEILVQYGSLDDEHASPVWGAGGPGFRLTAVEATFWINEPSWNVG